MIERATNCSASGFYADLEPWGYHVLHCERS